MDRSQSANIRTSAAHEGSFLPGRIFAAPSWVVPGTLAENCVFLATRVDEVGLLFFESQSCLAYEEADLPALLADFPLRYHVHLPNDLPMDEPARAAAICHALLEKVAYLSGGMENGSVKRPDTIMGVLHPPCHDPAESARAARLLENFLHHFARLGGRPESLLLENIAGNDLLGLRALIRESGLGVCLDLGHALAYEQKKLLQSPFFLEAAGMLHLNAPGRGKAHGAHLPLAALDRQGHAVAARLLNEVSPRAVIMLELFNWEHIKDSLPFLHSWLKSTVVETD